MRGLTYTLASLKTTLAGMLWLGLGALISYRQAEASLWWLTAPLVLLGVNLIAALLVNPKFRRQPGLMVFHLCLLVVIVLAAAGQMAVLKARVEITEGQDFSPDQLMVQQQGPWHPRNRLHKVSFVQGRIRVDYAPGLVRGATLSQIWMTDGKGGRTSVTIGDTTPLKAAGYRFYTTSNKGYALVLTWLGEAGQIITGSVHLPSYPLNDWMQLNRWTTPQGEQIELGLELPRPAPTDRGWTLDSEARDGRLTVKSGSDTVTVRPGETIALTGGRLRFDGQRTWMGYELYYNPTLPWLFAAAIVGVAGLAWHFWGKLSVQPRRPNRENTTFDNQGESSHVRV